MVVRVPSERFRPVPNRSVPLRQVPSSSHSTNLSRTYYDADSDREAQKNYYGGLQLSNTPVEAFQQISNLLMDTHTQQLDYNPRDHNWVHMSPDLRLQSIYSGDEEKAEAAGHLRFSLPPVSARKLKRRPGAAEKALSKLESEARELANEIGASFDPLQIAEKVAEFEARRFFSMEHVVPRNWFEKLDPMKGDLHILFPERKDRNSFRGSLPLRDLPGEGDQRSKDAYEPKGGKGASARATLYFLARYPHFVGDAGELQKSDIEQLKAWSRQDPPDLYERHRNAEIQKEQGNRNPFIDHPEWVDRIDFTAGVK